MWTPRVVSDASVAGELSHSSEDMAPGDSKGTTFAPDVTNGYLTDLGELLNFWRYPELSNRHRQAIAWAIDRIQHGKT